MIGPAGFLAAPRQLQHQGNEVEPRKARKLGSRQVAVIQMMNPEWVSSGRKPDSSSLSVLRSLEERELVYENFGRWYLTVQGRAAKATIEL